MSLMRVSISWNQSRALSQRLPRFSKTEGSPVHFPSRRARRGYGDLRPGLIPKENADTRPQSISYRLPKLPDDHHSALTHGYVFKEPYNEAQFLLRKDPRATHPTDSATSRIPSKNRKTRQTAPPPGTRNLFSRSGLRARGVPPPWTQAGIRDISLPTIESDPQKPRDPRTTPHSEVDGTLMPAVQLRTKTPSHPPSAIRDDIKQRLPAVLVHKSYEERKLTWQLSPYDNKNFDKQGLGPNQGPFSRELPKKCMPPNNWLRMKLRHRIQMRKAERRQTMVVV